MLLILYWMETAIIGFWTIVRVAAQPAAGGSARGLGIAPLAARFGLAARNP